MTLALLGEFKKHFFPMNSFCPNVSLLGDADKPLGGLSEMMPVNRLLSLSRVTGFGVGQGFRSAVGTNPLGVAGMGERPLLGHIWRFPWWKCPYNDRFDVAIAACKKIPEYLMIGSGTAGSSQPPGP